MPNAASSYDPDGGLRTVTESPNMDAINLQRELLNDRRGDYNERRAQRGTERPRGVGASMPATRQPYRPEAADVATLGVGPGREPFQRSSMPPLIPYMHPGAPMLGPGYTMDVNAMGAEARRAFLPNESKMQGPIGDAEDPGWLQFVAMGQGEKAKAMREEELRRIYAAKGR